MKHLPRAPLATVVALLSLFFVTSLARAASADELAGPSVARISVINGDVGIRRGDTQDTVAASINAPLLAGDAVSAGDDARGEVQLESRSMIRFGRDVDLRFLDLDPGRREAQLAQGLIEVRVLNGSDVRPQIDTPSIAIRPSGDGAYRISVYADGHTELTVRSGRAEVETPQGPQYVSSGSTLLARGPANSPTIESVAAIAYDAFDQFNSARDGDVQRGFANAYVPAAIGYADFNQYGHWVYDGSYGRVWVPYVTVADWAPYRYGRWVWVGGYGWTWVGAEPWAWAPYHYGRWYQSAAYGWCWYPPPVAVRPVWSPALVGFITFGSPGFQAGITFGNVGWVPLAPFEVYHPWYGWYGPRFGPTVVNNITYVNVTYVNRTAVTAVTSERFLQGRFDHPQALTTAQLHNVQVVHGALAAVPTQRNLQFADRAVSPQLTARTAVLPRSFAGNATPVQHATFTEQRARLQSGITASPLESVHASAQPSYVRPVQPYRTPAYQPTYRRIATPIPSYRTPVPSYRTPAPFRRPVSRPTARPTPRPHGG